MATRTANYKKPRSRSGITLNEFSDHFLDILNAIHTGEVQGIAMAVVTAESPTSDRVGVMSSTLTKHPSDALILRDATRDLWKECEETFHDWMEEQCRKQATSTPTGTVKLVGCQQPPQKEIEP